MSRRTSSAHRPLVAGIATVSLSSLLLAACGSGSTPGSLQGPAGGPTTAGGSDAAQAAGPEIDADAGQNEKEAGALEPRLLMSHDGGLVLMEADTGKVITEKKYDAFMRLANAGDGRHVMVADGDTFRVYDTGIQAQTHGDHYHNYEYTPGLTGTTFAMPHAGHVVLHHGRTVLFADGTGEIKALDSDKIVRKSPTITESRTDSPHHGVAVELADGTLVRTEGTKDERSTILAVKDGKTIAKTTDCPGVHGEAVAEPTGKGDVLAFGCENGPVVYRDGAFHKVPVEDAYSRSGNLFGHEESPIVLGDYKVDKDAEPVERPTRIALIDTRKDTLKLVDLRAPYWFRSFARGPQGEGLVLTYDGTLHKLDVTSGKETGSVKVVQEWKEKDDWQEPGPAVKVAGDKAYVTDADNQKLSVFDVATMKVLTTYDLPAKPVEIAITTGKAEAPADAHEGHDHGEHGDDHGEHGDDHGEHGDDHGEHGDDHGDEPGAESPSGTHTH